MSSYYKKKRQQKDDTRIDDWLITYADMITLLLCFFALIIAMSAPKKEQFEKAQKEMQEQFKVKSKDILYMDSIMKLPFGRTQDLYEKTEQYEKEEGIQVDQKDKITIIEMNSATFFPRGSAELNADGFSFLDKIAKDIQSPAYAKYQVTVEGHTDDSPINTAQFPSNWELSTARAAAVVRYFVEHGVPAWKLRAAGYADAFAKVPNRDPSGNPIPENQAKNRRVVIKFEKIDKAKAY